MNRKRSNSMPTRSLCKETVNRRGQPASQPSEDGALFPLLVLLLAARCEARVCSRGARRGGCDFGLLPLVADGLGDGAVEDVFHAVLLLAAALHVEGAHLLGDGTTLVGRHGGKALRLEQLDATPLVAQV